MEHLKAIEPLIAEIRGPVAQEFEARRSEHAELIALRANYDQAQRVVAQIQAEEREVSARLAAAETALGESDARRQTQDAALEDNALEIDRLRNALLQSDLKVSSLDASLRDALAQKDALMREIHHRVKNNLQVISSLLNMQQRARTDPAARAAMSDTRQRITALALI